MTTTDIKNYRAIVALNFIINGDRAISADFPGGSSMMKPIVIDLLDKGYLSIIANNFVASDKGQEAMNAFMNRYTEYLKVYDIYAFVDLEAKEMAFDRYYDFETDEEWNEYKSDPRFKDMRIAVALFKKLNPSEIVFMSFVNENRFDFTQDGWEKGLTVDSPIWKEIDLICETAIKPEDIGEDGMKEILGQGSDILMNLVKTEEAIEAEKAAITSEMEQESSTETITEEVTETIVEEEVYYESYYYDPFYISPFWVAPIFLW